jgi:catechol 2,3-dioxygenase-like lactoylglutathione lyase family enzyme
MKVTRILHASVNVHGHLDDTARWYEETLGLAPADRPEIPGVPGRWFGVGAAQVHLVGAPPSGPPIDPTGPHFCLAVDDIAATRAELEAAGVAYVEAAQGDVVQLWIVDPAGNTVELQEDRDLS